MAYRLGRRLSGEETGRECALKVVPSGVTVHVKDLTTEIQSFTKLRLHRFGHNLVGGDSSRSDHAPLVADESDDVEFPVFQCLGQKFKVDIVESSLRSVSPEAGFILPH